MENPYAQCYCDLCGFWTYKAYMTETHSGLCCDKCAALPPYSDELYSGIVAFQRLFRAHFAATAKPCGQCHKLCLKRTDFLKDTEPICEECLEEELDALREESCDSCCHNPCLCHDDGWCSECEGEWGCVCAERAEDERRHKERKHLVFHRKVCGDKSCDGHCGTLDCGCIDVCRRRYAACEVGY